MSKEQMNEAEAVNTETCEVTYSPPRLKVKRHVTLPILKQRVGIPIQVVFLSAMFKGKEMEGSKYDEPATIANVYDLLTGTRAQLILTTIEKAKLLEEYPDDGYVNKAFAIKLVQAEGKNYHLADIAELELPEGFKIPTA